MNNTLNFIVRHHNQVYLPSKWAELLNIKIIDADGWKKEEWIIPIDLHTFVEKVTISTIGPVKIVP